MAQILDGTYQGHDSSKIMCVWQYGIEFALMTEQISILITTFDYSQ